ncbi:MAG: hypothetical protein AAFN81_22060 [Bacteroidota bacterium]
MILSKLHFKDGLPSMAEVRTQFHKQTGLNLWIIADLHLQDIPTDNFSALAQINKDLKATHPPQAAFICTMGTYLSVEQWGS